MKTLALLLTLTVFAASAQTIRIADKNPDRPTGANIYSTLQAAIDAAVPGDIVYITPVLSSQGNYGTVTIGKRITLQGASIGSRFSWVGTINLIPSSDGFTSISNSVFKDLYSDFINFTTGGSGSFTFNDIVFDNVGWYRFTSSGTSATINRLTIKNGGFAELRLTSTNGINDIKICKNVLSTDPFTRPITLNYSTNVVISNNLIYSNTGNYTVDIQNSSNVLITNNIFSGSGQVFNYLSNAIVINNIFFGQTPGCVNTTNAFGNNSFSNNLVATPGFVIPPAGNGGFVNSGLNNLPSGTNPQFVSATAGNVHSATYNYTLAASSACIGTGSGGDNIGPSGGLCPFTTNIIRRDSSVPTITLFDNTGSVPQNQPLKSNIKAKAN
jgi:hypothetical protein